METYKFWTQEEDDLLAALARSGLTAKEIAVKMKRSTASITNRAKKKRVKFFQSPIFPGDMSAYTLDNLKKLWEWRIAKRLKINSECLEWKGSTDSKGYGQIRAFGKLILVHRIALQIKIGRLFIEEEKALHTCDNPSCCNPDHLFIGTQKDNVADMMKKGRNGGQFQKGHTGLASPSKRFKKFKKETIIAAREEHEKTGIGHKRLAKKYGMSPGNMRAVLKRSTWKHV